MSRKIMLCLFMPVLIAAAGCTYAPKASNMTVIDERFRYESSGKSLLVEPVTGGTTSSFGGGSRVDNGEFMLALVGSLMHSNLFSRVVTTGDADYRLKPIIAGQSQPGTGYEVTVNMKVAYYLYETAGDSLVFEKIIDTWNSGGDSAFGGGKIIQKANEQMAWENIALLLNDLSQLGL